MIGKYGEFTNEYYDGKIRDVRVYNYLLSDDQVSSLYSGSYNVTPLHGWKLDEGHATAALGNASGAWEDFGTGTDSDGQGRNLVDASMVDGTLNLDAILTIGTSGTLSAPRGNLDLGLAGSSNVFSRTGNAVFTHNNGKVKITYAAASTQLTSAAFYDLEIATGTVSYIVKLYHGTAVDIYNNLTLTSGVLDMYVADDLIDIHGLTNIASGARCWYSADDNTNTITHHGLVTNLGIFYINDGTTVKLNGGLRQLGTLTIKA